MKRLFLLLTLLILGLNSNQALAQPSQSDIETQKRLLEVEKLATQSAASTSAQKATSLTFIKGYVTSTANQILLLQTDFGQKTIYSIDSTRYINLSPSGKKLIGYGDIKVSETVLVLGLNHAASSGVAKIIVRDQTAKAATFSLLGKISEKTDTNLLLADFLRSDLPTIKVAFNQTTLIRKSSQKINFSALVKNDKLISVGSIDGKGTLLAKEIAKIN